MEIGNACCADRLIGIYCLGGNKALVISLQQAGYLCYDYGEPGTGELGHPAERQIIVAHRRQALFTGEGGFAWTGIRIWSEFYG
jgi:hypothetical protein